MTDKEFCKVCLEELEGMFHGTPLASDEEVKLNLNNKDTMVQLIARAVNDLRKMQTVS
jgi:hypothetical protein